MKNERWILLHRLGHGHTSTSKARAAKKFLLLVSGERHMDLNIGEKHVFEVRSPELKLFHILIEGMRKPWTVPMLLIVRHSERKKHQTVKEMFNNPKQFNEE